MCTSASNKRCKTVIGTKQGNDSLLDGWANTDNEIWLRGAGEVQDTVKSCKETAEEVLEVQVMVVLQARVTKENQDNGTAVLGKGLQLIRKEEKK